MKVAICFDGVDDEALAAALPEFLRDAGPVESLCAYGDAAQRLVEQIAERHHGPAHPQHHPPHHRSLDEEQAAAIARHGCAILERHGVTATARTVGGSNAEHAIAEFSGPNVLLVLAAGHREGIGPRSVGHVARFVIDHARGPVTVLRL
jgi:hypothetical protein